MGVRVLLIEDDRTIAEPLVEGLANFGLTVNHVATGIEGLRAQYGDVVLLDLGLPDIDGIDVCRGIRQTSDVPIIILSARGEEADRVLGLELGADDYLAKPFSMRELVARVRAVTRRAQRRADPGRPAGGEPFGGESFTGAGAAPFAEAAPRPFAEPAPPASGRPAPVRPVPRHPALGRSGPERSGSERSGSAALAGAAASASATPAAPGAVGPLVVDRRTRQVWVGEAAVTLTPKEFELLALLTEDPGAVYSRQQILDRVWDPHYQGPTKTLDVHVATLRRKLGNPAWIQTLRGVGFRLAVHTSAPGAQQTYAPPASAPAPASAPVQAGDVQTAPAQPAYTRPARPTQSAYDSTDHDFTAYDSGAYGSSAYGSTAYEPSAYEPSAYSASAYRPSAYEPSAYEPPAYDEPPSAYEPRRSSYPSEVRERFQAHQDFQAEESFPARDPQRRSAAYR